MKIPFVKIRDRHHAVFVIAATLIGGLFVVSVIAILLGKFTPFADIVPTAPTPRQTVALDRAQLTYNDNFATTTIQSNATQVVVAPYPLLEVGKIAGLPDSRLTLNSLAGKISYKNTSNNAALVTDANWNATGATDRLKTELTDKTNILDKLDALTGSYNLSVLIKPTNSLAVRFDGVTNYENPIQIDSANKPIIPADFDNNNRIDDADITSWKADYGKNGNGITTTNRPKDFNQDGVINEADYAAIFSEYYNRTGDTMQ